MSKPASRRVPAAINRLITSFYSKPRLRAGSLLLTLFGDVLLPRGGRVWLGSLIQLLAPLGVNERMIRTAIFRLTQEDWLAAQAVGRRADYFLTTTGRQRIAEASRLIYAGQSQPWDHHWRLLFVVKDLGPQSRELLRSALLWHGFGNMGANCFIHPSADLSRIFAALKAEGLTELVSSLLPMQASHLYLGSAASNQALIEQAWNLPQLQLRYKQFVQTYTPILHVIDKDDAQVDPHTAFLIRLLLIHDYRRLMLRDPELPSVLLPKAWAGEAARTVCRQLYKQLIQRSEMHLNQMLVTANGQPLPPARRTLHARFGAHKTAVDAG